MSGQRSDSSGGAGTAESAAAGCSLSERLRPKIRKSPDLEGLAVFTVSLVYRSSKSFGDL